MKIDILRDCDFEVCASAASMSYGKDLTTFTKDEKAAYVRKIWDKHYNVSEHMVKTLVFTKMPRFISMMIGAQGNGITITEFSQRRRKVVDSFVFNKLTELNDETAALFAEYNKLIDSGVKLEEARAVLPVTAFTDLQVTLNREHARDIAMRDFAQREASKSVPWLLEMLETEKLAETLMDVFEFDTNVANGPGLPIRKQEPYMSAPAICSFDQTYSGKFGEVDDGYDVEVIGKCRQYMQFAMSMPVYSFMQFQRHRTSRIFVICVKRALKDDKISHTLMRNGDTLYCIAESLDWDNFFNLRTHSATQEPLRSIAHKMKNI